MQNDTAPPATRAPVVIGVAGGSGSGKTTVVRKIVETLGEGQVSVLSHDRYYRSHPEIDFDQRAQLNFDHPKALETSLMVQHVGALRAGKSIEAPIYNFAQHLREEHTDTITPGSVLLIEGILILADAPLCQQMDIKIFVDTDDDIRFIRRMTRDTTERGRTIESVISQYLSTVKPMHLEFVAPSRRNADMIVPEGGHNQVAIDMLLTLIRSLAPVSNGRT